MTRFKHHDRIFFPGAASPMQLMTETENDWKNLFQPSANAVTDARMLLQRTNAQLSAKRLSDKVIKYANRYFLTGKDKVSAADLATITQTVSQISTGLLGDVTVKVGTEPGLNGVVNNKQEPDGTPTPNRWSYHNCIITVDDGLEWRTGAIHVSANRMVQGRFAVKTLIHEASHKYAGTMDYCYFNDDSKTPRSAFDDKAKALVNADSYGWFVLKVGRSHSGTFNSMYSS